MQQHRHPACDLLTDVISGQCTLAERKEFEAHLDVCPSCSEEYAALQSVWDHLYLAQEEFEPPASLKEEALGSLFEPSPPTAAAKPRFKNWHIWMSAAAVIVALMSSLNGYFLYQSQQAEQTALNEPAKIVQLFRLTSDAAEPSKASGVACIVERNGNRELIVYGYGLPKTEGEQAYQVWLIHDGVRTNAGTFNVEDQGLGVLTYKLDKSFRFEKVGITLEPDSNGNEPRGQRVLGS